MNDLNEINFLHDSQHGFRAGRSVTTNLLEFYDGVTDLLDKRNAVDILYFDMAKAFDKVKHSLLMIKLRSLKLNECYVNWIENFLKGRKQRVVVRGEKSNWLDVYSGVPQGSVIGPLLFLIFINDITSNIKSTINIFADDTKIMNKVNNADDIMVLQNDVLLLENWCKKNEMMFNESKCSTLHCGGKNMEYNYLLNSKIIKKVVSEKDLGIVISKDMKFKDNISNQIKKANKILGIIKRNFNYIDKKLFIILYSMLVRPHLETAVQLWSPWQVTEKDRLEMVQRRATKLVKEISKLSYDDRLKELNLMTTEDRRKRGDMILTYKILNKKIDFRPKILRLSHELRTRGHHMKLEKYTSNLDIRKYFFFYRITNEWNGLGHDIISSQTVEAFKKAYDRNKSFKQERQHKEK